MSSTIECKQNYFCITLSGAFDDVYGEIQRLRQEMFNHPEFSEPCRSLWDLRGVTSAEGYSMNDLRNSQDQDDMRPEKIAYLFEGRFAHGLVRQYLGLQDPDKAVEDVLLTSDPEEADEFLRS